MTKVAVKVARIIAVILGASMVFWLDDDLDLGILFLFSMLFGISCLFSDINCRLKPHANGK